MTVSLKVTSVKIEASSILIALSSANVIGRIYRYNIWFTSSEKAHDALQSGQSI